MSRKGKKLDAMKVSELIKMLQQIKKEAGDLPVVISHDEEGNSFGTTMAHHSVQCYDGRVTLFPVSTYLENDDGSLAEIA